MNINGSPESLKLFGFNTPEQDLTASGSFIATPANKRSCFKTPNLSKISPLAATLNRSLNGIYSSKEVQDNQSLLSGSVWDAALESNKATILKNFSIKDILNSSCVYHGKVAHVLAMIKSVDQISSKDTTIVLADQTGEMKASVHKQVLEKYGPLLEVGNVMLLQQCTVFSFISVQKYLNITPLNVVHIFSEETLSPAREVTEKHYAEVSRLNILKENNPDTEIYTPSLTTPNKPMPRPIKPTNTPTNKPMPRPIKPTTTPTKIPPQNNNIINTPVRGRQRFIGGNNNTAGCSVPQKRAVVNEPTANKKVKEAARPNTEMSLKEKEAIDKLLEDIGDDFFEDLDL